MSQLIHGTHQQSYIAHVILYAACIEGPDDMAHCEPAAEKSSFHQMAPHQVYLMAAILVSSFARSWYNENLIGVSF